jgi:D-alanyl-lipoteichoic acid acyltransferase DltB (MBOAT superfamily)
LLFFTAGVDFLVALGMSRTGSAGRRKLLMGLSLTANLGLLGFFKYYDFFLRNFVEAFTLLGHHMDARPLSIVLPVGISFYTFQSLSYTFDVYRKQLPAIKTPSVFFAFVSFFPQLLAGPIERARHMLPQFGTPRRFDEASAYDGVRQMLWGLFKKVVVADNCAAIVNPVFADHGAHTGGTLLLALVLFAFQIYCDFSGYSDIAIGCARLLGFELMRNFAYPYFSRDIAEFWRRWHISLSTWFRDYLYIPLGGNRRGRGRTMLNVMIIFVVSGFWHGANWTFIVWGAANGLLLLVLMLRGDHHTMTGTVAHGRALPTLRESAQMLLTFALTCIVWTFFRADSMTQVAEVFRTIASPSLFRFSMPGTLHELLFAGAGIGVMLVLEWIARERQYGLQLDGIFRRPVRFGIYYGLIAMLILMAPLSGGEFIYFQF